MKHQLLTALLAAALATGAQASVVSIDFDTTATPSGTQSGEPTNPDGLALPGQVGAWHSLGIGAAGAVDKTATLSIDTGSGVFTFNPGGTDTYRSYHEVSDPLRTDVLYLQTAVTGSSIDWTITGLTAGASYDLILFGQWAGATDGPANPADFTVTGYNGGAAATLDADNDGNFVGVTATGGTISGTLELSGATFAGWSGLQFEQTKLLNRGFEYPGGVPTGTPATSWDGGTLSAAHSAFSKAGNEQLGGSFGYTLVSNADASQSTGEFFAAGMTYTFNGWSVDNDVNDNDIEFKIGYIDGGFVELASAIYSVDDLGWTELAGVSWTVLAGATEIGEEIVVRIGDVQVAGGNGTWFDNVSLTMTSVAIPSPAALPAGLLLIGVAAARRQRT